jgi:hypothetical protein
MNIKRIALAGLPASLALFGVGLTPAHAAGPSSPSVTGGGRYDTSECAINFALNGHQTPTGATGTQSAVMSNAPGAIPGCPGQGQITATVTCVAVNGPDAEIRGVITKQTGSFSPEFFPPGDTTFVTDAQDNGNPSSGTPDTIVQYVDAPGTQNNCVAPAGDQLFTVDQGNITVQD